MLIEENAKTEKKGKELNIIKAALEEFR